MRRRASRRIICLSLFIILAGGLSADRRAAIYSLGMELERQASYLARISFDHFKGRDSAISDEEQGVLFKAEAFAASTRLFLRLTEERSNYFGAGYLRTSLYNAFIYLAHSFQELEAEMRRAGIMPYSLSDCRKILNLIDGEFSRWPAADNLAYLHQKYVKGRDATVYMIERLGPGEYVRHAFKDLESIFRYNYDLQRGKDPWKYLVEVPSNTLERMEEGEMIELTFEGLLVIEQSDRPNRAVYLIEDGEKRGLASPRVLERFGGWGRVFEVPAEVIEKYPEGQPID